MTCAMRSGKLMYMYHKIARLVYWHSREQFLKLDEAIIQHPPFWDYDTWWVNSMNDWGCGQWCIMKTRSMDSLGWKLSNFLDQASRCHVGMAGSSWLHRCGMGCHRHWCQGVPLNSWHGRDSWGLACLGCWCCRCSGCGLHMMCRLWQCRLYC